jgi:hypothetical protein
MDPSETLVVGEGHISAKVLAHSITEWGKEIVTFELEYHRFIHAEIMTHRLFSRNCASSRAIPTKKMLALIRGQPAVPIFWGKNQAGMQAVEECSEKIKWKGGKATPEKFWLSAMDGSLSEAEAFAIAGYHKQVVNRLTEPFQMIKVVVTATEFANFFHLRLHEAVQPELRELARCMKEALSKSKPMLRVRGEITSEKEYHLPYVSEEERHTLKIEDLIVVSVARCAAISYRNEDYPLEKCKEVYSRLIGGDRIHGSALEHIARSMFVSKDPEFLELEEGVTHSDRNKDLWSGNFKGWIQYRKLLMGECVW